MSTPRTLQEAYGKRVYLTIEKEGGLKLSTALWVFFLVGLGSFIMLCIF